MLRAFMHFGGTGAIVIGLAGLFFAVLAEPLTSDARRLINEGVQVRATVAELRTAGLDLAGRPRYQVTFEFDELEGSPVSVSKEISRQSYATLVEGGDVVVRYVPGDPQIFEVEPWRVGRTGRDFQTIATTLFGLALGFAGFAVVRARWARTARDTGIGVDARVTRHIWSLQTKWDGGTRFARLQWELTDESGDVHRGRSSPFNFYDVSDFPVGSRIRVYYSPEHPGRSYWSREI